jgi:hypothetical protein
MLPGAAVTAGPLLGLGGIALAADAAGLISLRRRDVGDLGTAGLPGLAGPVRDRLADHFFPPAETR